MSDVLVAPTFGAIRNDDSVRARRGCLRLGPVTELVEPDALADRATEPAARPAAAPPLAVSMSARMLEQAYRRMAGAGDTPS
ncbi:hypothetical protein [Rhodococcus sp. R1101]|uniref:hypothetical protein n=1 Tax=Rhodococcus sp. R1101 TaxID=1170698 RepID=UPI0002D48BD2|nr:hypothetical protein [Rhodococcus sp. R1101]